MKNSTSSLAFVVLLAASPVAAQDVPSIWNGQYAGLSLGVSHAEVDATSRTRNNGYFITTDPGQVNPQSSKQIEEVVLGGNMVWGINRQSGNTVFGLEADVSFIDFDTEYTSGNINYITLPARTFNVTTKVSSDWMVSLRPRVGYAQDKSLMYVSAGPAMTRFKYDFTFTDTNGPEYANIRSHKTKLGWAASVGYEQKLKDGWALKAEYLLSHFNNVATGNSALRTVATDGFDNSIDFETNNFRIGLIKSF